MKKNYIKWLQLFGIIVFVVILTRLDFQNIKNQLANFKWLWLVIYSLGLIFMLFFKVLRWRTALNKQDINFSVSKVYSINAVASFWGLITPARLGELAKVAFVQKEGYSFAKSLVSIVIDRLYDIVILILLGASAFVYLTSTINPNFSIITIVLGLVLAAVALIYFFKNGLWDMLKEMIKFLLPQDKYNTLIKEWNTFKLDFGKVFPSTIIPMLFYSLLAYLCYYVQIYVVALGFGVDVPFIYLGLCSSLAALISLLPISIGGLGTREAVFIYLLSKISISSETAVLISFIEGSVFAVLIMGLISFVSNFFMAERQGNNKK